MDELPDMPEDWQRFIVQVGQQAKVKEKAKWTYWQCLISQLIAVLCLLTAWRAGLVYVLIEDQMMMDITAAFAGLMGGIYIYHLIKAKQLLAKL